MWRNAINDPDFDRNVTSRNVDLMVDNKINNLSCQHEDRLDHHFNVKEISALRKYCILRRFKKTTLLMWWNVNEKTSVCRTQFSKNVSINDI